MRLVNKYLYDFIALIFINLFSIIAAFWVLGFSPLAMNVPWAISGDLIHYYATAQNLKDFGSLTIFPNLAWPYTSDLSSWGTVSLFDYGLLKLLTLFSSAIFTLNFYIIFTFALTTTFTYFLFKKFQFTVIASSFFSLFLSLLPWHFQRALWHVSYANYIAIPLFILLIYLIIQNQKLNSRSTFVRILLILLFISTLMPYYWLFIEILLFITIFYLFLTKNLNPKYLNKSIMILSIIPFVQAVTMFVLRSQSIYVSFSSPVERFYGFVERYSGSFIALFMPSPNSKIPFFGQLRKNFDNASSLGVGEAGPWNSIIGSAALIFILGIFIYFAVSNKRPQIFQKQSDSNQLFILILLLLFVITLMFYWTTGLGSIFAFFVSDWIRSWGRLYIFLVYFAFLISALLLRKLTYFENMTKTRSRIFLGTLVFIFIFDQIAKPMANLSNESKELFQEITEFSEVLDEKLSSNCPVLMLPVMKYPEAGYVGGVADYEQLLVYLANPARKYSYGAVKGTQEALWQEKIETKSVSKIVSQAAAVGYCAAVVDFRGYESTVETGNAWIKAAGKPIAVSKNTRLAAFKIDPQKSNPAAIQSLLTLTWKGKAEAGLVQGSKQIDFSGKKFELYALNPTKEKINGDIKFGVRGSKCDPSQELTIRDSNNNLIFQNDLSKTTQQISLKLALEPRAQSNFIFELSSSKCSIEWYSDALISVRNERFTLN
jgi:hypothetical protein